MVLRLILVLLLLVGCSKPEQPTTPTPTPTPTPEPTMPKVVTYREHMRPIFEKKCAGCHNNSVPDRNWLDYKTAYKKRDRIKYRVTVTKDMPQVFTITDFERKMIGVWVDQGAKE